MSSKVKSAKQKVVVGLKGNYDDKDGRRQISPVGGISNQEEIELKHINSHHSASNYSNDSKSYRNESAFNGSIGNDGGQFGDDEDEDEVNKSPESSREISVMSVRSGLEDNANQLATSKDCGYENWNPDDRRWDGKRKTAFGEEFAGDKKAQSIQSFGSRQTTDVSVFLASGLSGYSTDDLHNDVSANTSTRSTDPDDLALDYFCVDHMKLCSTEEVDEEHADCENVVPALEWADKQKIERDRKITANLLQRFDVFAGIMIDERHDLIRQLTESKEVVTDDFLELMEDLVTHLLKKQREFSETFDKLHSEKIKAIAEQIKHCVMVQRETSTCLRELADLDPNSEDYHRVKKKIHEKCPVYEEILRRDFQASTRMDYEFVPDKEVESILKELTSLGDVILRIKPSKLPGFLSQTREIDFTKRAIQNVQKHDGKCKDDTNTCSFSGCEFLPDDRILLADWNNSCIKMFDKHCVLVFRQELKTSPWDIKHFEDGKAVVTVPGEQKVYIMAYTNTGMKIMTSFSTESECWGITPIDDKFAVTCDPYSKSPSVKVFSNSGQLISFFQNDQHGKMLLQYPQHIATDNSKSILYISDSRQDIVLAVTIKGRVVFKYEHEKLRFPTGVATDNQGNVYVCGKDSKNVHQLSKEGEFVRILLDSSDELSSPRGICFEPNGERILVTDIGHTECDEFMIATLS